MTSTFRAEESIPLSSSIVTRGTSAATKVGACSLFPLINGSVVGVGGATVGGGAFVGVGGEAFVGVAVSVELTAAR